MGSYSLCQITKNNLEPMQNLWRAVIFEAINILKSQSKKKRLQNRKMEVYNYFTNIEHKDELSLVCELANFNIIDMTKEIQQIINAREFIDFKKKYKMHQ